MSEEPDKTVAPPTPRTDDPVMSVIGFVIAGGVAFLALPLLPVLLLLFAVLKGAKMLKSGTEEEDDSFYPETDSKALVPSE